MTTQYCAVVEAEKIDEFGLQKVEAGSLHLTLPLVYVKKLAVGDVVCLDISEGTKTPTPVSSSSILVMRGSVIASGAWGETISCGGLLFRLPHSHTIGARVVLSVSKTDAKK